MGRKFFLYRVNVVECIPSLVVVRLEEKVDPTVDGVSRGVKFAEALSLANW